eukprot:Lithocolla_globosa_v1_NODE_881_length_3142_cov_19.214772.p1 type:complete len:393 gc:universal NODE_881_length_3142_cov_19.214772:1917-3095(+)
MHFTGGPPTRLSMREVLLRHPWHGSLDDVLNSPLPFKIGISGFREIQQFADVFENADTEYGASLATWLDHLVVGDSEAAVVSLDNNWLCALTKCLCALVYRDEKDPSSLPRLRPDATIFLNGALNMKVEAKYLYADLARAEQELTVKMNSSSWRLLPRGCFSIPIVTSSATVVQLHTMYFDQTTRSFVLATPPRRYDVQDLSNRVSFVVDLFKLMRWMVVIPGPNQSFHLIPNVRRRTRNGHHVTWQRDGLLKEFLNPVTVPLPLMKQVYAAQLPHVEHGTTVNSHAVLISRVGVQLRTALLDRKVTPELAADHVQLALQELHSLNFAHCDVCVENTFVDDDGTVFLGDLEYLTPLNNAPPHITRVIGTPATAEELDKLQLDAFLLELMRVL